MSEIRIQFTRGREVMYISHLDLMRTFERAIRRAGIPVAYSQGFNPHPHMVFGLPLSVGVTSEAEYADFELEESISPDEFEKSLNETLPKGIVILRAAVKKSKTNIMAAIAGASYNFEVLTGREKGINDIDGILSKYLAMEIIEAEKVTKNGSRMIDIKPMILRFESSGVSRRDDVREGASYGFSSLLSAGSAANLKPELLLSSFSVFAGIEADYFRIHRTGLFVSMDGTLLDPMDNAVL